MHQSMPRIRLTSLLLVEERLLEAQYFAHRLRHQRDPCRIRYELNAFVAAARSVTFLLQKEMSAVPGFEAWWGEQRASLARDSAASFFVKLRNLSQHQGRISLVGVTTSDGPRRKWSYRFAWNPDAVPAALLHRDAAECCREHLAKLARIVLACTEAFPFHSCPKRALTPDGVAALQISLEDAEETLGFPRGWSQAAEPASEERRIKILSDHVDGLDFGAIRRLAKWKSKKAAAEQSASDVLSEDIAKALVVQLEGQRRVNSADLALSLLLGGPVERDI